MKVFKFGGASVNSASAVRNMASIVIRHQEQSRLVVVVSAMGKTTNALEQMIPGVRPLDERLSLLSNLKQYHFDIINELFPDKNAKVYSRIESLFDLLEKQISIEPTTYNFDYDQTVSFGELISTSVISEYLNHIGINNTWIDVRSIITTDTNYREGHVDWTISRKLAVEKIEDPRNQNIIITQGFIAGTPQKTTTTLGREGSDYSASILSYCLKASEMTIWKDVPGFLNADPKYFKNTIKINEIPYNEAIELAYYGASVIHPKTVKPLQNSNIKLQIKSFLTPDEEGSVIGPFHTIQPQTPLYIFKNNQILLSIIPKDFSFIAEDNLQTIFATLAELNIKVNMMQNSALSFSICIDHNTIYLEEIQKRLSSQFKLKYNDNLQLITIRYYTHQIIKDIVGNRNILLEQKSRNTTQLIVEKE